MCPVARRSAPRTNPVVHSTRKGAARGRPRRIRLGAVGREIIELHVETPTVAVDPGSAYRLPETALTVFGHGVNPVARGGGCLAHVMCLSSWFESHAPCAASWGTKARAEKRRVSKVARRAPRSGAELAGSRRRPKRAALKTTRVRA